jgi:hypothetical protein
LTYIAIIKYKSRSCRVTLSGYQAGQRVYENYKWRCVMDKRIG